ncbi:hypothetical protein HMPREF1544_09515 [Mucor circinelloides 1006PhL]|uniref:Uncharacterized protein n=1 Tax=Mucor circinelloides f. circinelloides (strain 1006PhL) TaxID=1220926 RepID=S2J0X5_MUCC1|nr:hypothetical protein HMPREF1544_09515 [Mucor circinelloides 1006PhL]
MPRIPIYPEVEKFIILKKHTKLKEVESDNKKENSTTQTPKRTSTKRKDSPALIKAKRNAKRSRQASTSAASSSKNNCSSCQEEGHSSARSSQCKNYNPKLSERLQIRLGSHQRYTLSVPFETLCNDNPNKANALKKVKDISSFVREVLFKAQLFVNHFILQHPTKLTNDFFEQNFWYTISRVIRGSSDTVKSTLQAYKDTKKGRPAGQNLDVDQLASSFVNLSATTNGSLFVSENGLKNYGQSLLTACETVATTYNNYYIEKFENIISLQYTCFEICNNCLKEDLENLKISRDNKETKIHQVLKCKTCNIYWNRDVMASKNMHTIATSIWCGNGHPQVFKRHTATSNVVVVAHSGESAT